MKFCNLKKIYAAASFYLVSTNMKQLGAFCYLGIRVLGNFEAIAQQEFVCKIANGNDENLLQGIENLKPTE